MIRNTAIKFVEPNATGVAPKRKQVSEACEECRRKKKRCVHAVVGDNSRKSRASMRKRNRDGRFNSLPAQGDLQQVQVSPSSTEEESLDTYISRNTAHLKRRRFSRYISDLDPEGVLIEATTANVDENESSYRTTNELGGWFRQSAPSMVEPGNQEENMARDTLDGPLQLYPVSKSPFVAAYERARYDYLTKACMTLLPPREDYEALKSIYCERIQPIFPILRDKDINCPETSPYTVLVRQVVVLSAATDPDATAHLRLETNGPLLSFQEFHQRLSTAIFAVIEADMIPNRLHLVRILIMLSLYYQATSANDRSRPALLCTQALHHFQTLGGHLLGYRCEKEDENIELLFCALWALDRLSGAFYGMAFSFHERDYDRDLNECINMQKSPAFRLFMRTTMMLNQVINLYRPKQAFEFLDLPAYETIIVDTGSEKLPTVILTTIELLYHAISLLSCRQSAGIFSDNAPRNCTPVVDARRSLSTDCIVRIAQNQKLCPSPFLPHALSLALSVQYRELRYSRTALFRNRAYLAFKDIIILLKRISDIFYNAMINASLGESILKEMEKTANSLHVAAREDSDQVIISNPGIEAPGTAVPAPEGAAMTANAITPISITDVAPNSMGDYAIPNEGYGLGELDSSLCNNINMDVDLFGYFDPSFALGEIDDALEANLQMRIPQSWNLPWDDSVT